VSRITKKIRQRRQLLEVNIALRNASPSKGRELTTLAARQGFVR
jgi:hypothetical protein